MKIKTGHKYILKKKDYNKKMILLGIIILLLAILLVGLLLFLGYQAVFSFTMLHGPVFVASADEKLQTMLEIATVPQNAKIIDLGSGDGKVLIALAEKFKTHIDGVEINPILVRRSRKNIQQAGLEKQITVISKSFWDIDLSSYDVVYLYGTSYIMKKMEEKIQKEMRPGTQFVSNFFELPTLQPSKVKNEVRLYQL